MAGVASSGRLFPPLQTMQLIAILVKNRKGEEWPNCDDLYDIQYAALTYTHFTSQTEI